MELAEINKIIEDTEKKLNNIKEMISDYNICNNETSKSILLAAISKYITPFKPQLIIK